MSINHGVDTLPLPFLGFHAWMLAGAAADQNMHFYPMHREFLTITLSRNDRGESPESSQSVGAQVRICRYERGSFGGFYPHELSTVAKF
jgi:hypothetical protein